MFGRPGATGWTSTSIPSLRSQRSTYSATAASVASGSPGRTTLGRRTRSRVSATSSASSTWASAARRREAAVNLGGLFVRERQDHGVQANDPVLLARNVEVVALHLLRALLEGHDRLEARHLAKGVGPLVETIPAGHDLSVPDRRTLRAVDTDVRGTLGQQSNKEVDPVDLNGDGGHRPPSPVEWSNNTTRNWGRRSAAAGVTPRAQGSRTAGNP